MSQNMNDTCTKTFETDSRAFCSGSPCFDTSKDQNLTVSPYSTDDNDSCEGKICAIPNNDVSIYEDPCPQRPLSAYNVFFRMERQRILDEIDKRDMGISCENGNHSVYSSEEVALFVLNQRAILFEKSKLRDPPKRKHVKSHGKIGFAELARSIANRWKEISNEERHIFQCCFDIEMDHYKEELEKWFKRNPDHPITKEHNDNALNRLEDEKRKSKPTQTKKTKKKICARKRDINVSKQRFPHTKSPDVVRNSPKIRYPSINPIKSTNTVRMPSPSPSPNKPKTEATLPRSVRAFGNVHDATSQGQKRSSRNLDESQIELGYSFPSDMQENLPNFRRLNVLRREHHTASNIPQKMLEERENLITLSPYLSTRPIISQTNSELSNHVSPITIQEEKVARMKRLFQLKQEVLFHEEQLERHTVLLEKFQRQSNRSTSPVLDTVASKEFSIFNSGGFGSLKSKDKSYGDLSNQSKHFSIGLMFNGLQSETEIDRALVDCEGYPCNINLRMNHADRSDDMIYTDDISTTSDMIASIADDTMQNACSTLEMLHPAYFLSFPGLGPIRAEKQKDTTRDVCINSNQISIEQEDETMNQDDDAYCGDPGSFNRFCSTVSSSQRNSAIAPSKLVELLQRNRKYQEYFISRRDPRTALGTNDELDPVTTTSYQVADTVERLKQKSLPQEQYFSFRTEQSPLESLLQRKLGSINHDPRHRSFRKPSKQCMVQRSKVDFEEDCETLSYECSGEST